MAVKDVPKPPEPAAALLSHTWQGDQLPDTFTLLGREWDLHREVFPDTVTAATEVMASALPYPPDGAFLQLGCGTGVIAVTAALAGCATVTALDSNTRAVANTLVNAERHGVSHRLTALRSDLFAALPRRACFDTIFWNAPWTLVPAGFPLGNALHSAVFDPGYQGQARYMARASRHLTPGGRLFLGTADLADRNLLVRLAARAGLRVEVLRRIRRIEFTRVMEYQLLELHRFEPAERVPRPR